MSDVLIEFWSDIKNVENASAEDIQRDILAYLEQRKHYKSQVEEMQKTLEWYADKDNWKARARCGNCGHHLETDIDEDAAEFDAGYRARETIQSLKEDKPNGNSSTV